MVRGSSAVPAVDWTVNIQVLRGKLRHDISSAEETIAKRLAAYRIYRESFHIVLEWWVVKVRCKRSLVTGANHRHNC